MVTERNGYHGRLRHGKRLEMLPVKRCALATNTETVKLKKKMYQYFSAHSTNFKNEIRPLKMRHRFGLLLSTKSVYLQYTDTAHLLLLTIVIKTFSPMPSHSVIMAFSSFSVLSNCTSFLYTARERFSQRFSLEHKPRKRAGQVIQ